MTHAPKTVRVGQIEIGNDRPVVLIAGPCQIEDADQTLAIAEDLSRIAGNEGMGFVFKSSFDKANRTSIGGKRGPGIEEGLAILSVVGDEIGCPVLTDIHETWQCDLAARCVDILQIPAFLCRQTDLLLAAGRTGAAVNVKKGQFLSPWEMSGIVDKITSTGNERLLLCERGTCFGYNNLVNDMRSLPIMAATGYPIVIDATHSVQEPGGQGTSSGGRREFAPVIARAAVATGVAAVFIETHPDPDLAPSDGPNMIRIDDMPELVSVLNALDVVAKSAPVEI